MKIRRPHPIKRIPKPVVWTVISLIALSVLLIGIGAAYTWYMGQNATKVKGAFAEPVVVEKPPVIKPAKPAADAAVGVAIHSLTTPVTPGSNAGVTIQTNPDAECAIVVEYNKIASKDTGLITKTADEYGVASWSWTVDYKAPLGKWPVQITCTSAIGKSGMVKGDLEVVKG